MHLLWLGMSVALLGACTTDSGESTETLAPLPATASSIDVPAVSATTSPAVTTTAATTTTAASTTTVPTTAAPTTTPPTTAPEPDPIGDGPVLSGQPDGEAGAPSSGLAPAFFVFEAAREVECTPTASGTAILRWEVIGAETVDIAIGSADEIFRLAEPPAGALEVPLGCTDGSTYFVTASNADGSTTRSVHVDTE